MKSKFLILLILFFLISNCASIIKGDFSKVEILNAPKSLEVFHENDVMIEVNREYKLKVKNPEQGISNLTIDTVAIKSTYINLRSNNDHVLKLKYDGKEEKIIVYRQIGFGWVFLDVLFGIVPFFVDSHTEAWNGYDSIELKK